MTFISRITRAAANPFAAVALTAILATACSYDTATTPPVTVTPVSRVEITPTTVALVEGDTRDLVAVPRDAAGQALANRTVTWTSGDPTLVEVTASGHLVAKGVGATTVTATVEGKTASAAVTVKAAIAFFAVTPTALLMQIGQTRQLTAVIRDARGNNLTGREVMWTTDAPTATVSSTGLLTAVQPGFVTVFATCEGKTFALAATVIDPAL